MKNKKNLNKQAGQIVLLLVLLTMVGLTVGLSLISRTVTDVRISSQIEQSSRAFSAAEAGIETALRGLTIDGPMQGSLTLPGPGGSQNETGNATASYIITNIAGNSLGETYHLPLADPGDSQAVWLTGHDPTSGDPDLSGTTSYPWNRNFTVCWGTAQLTEPPAVVLTLVYLSQKNNLSSIKYSILSYDPLNRGNGFTAVGGNPSQVCEGRYLYFVTLSPADFGVSDANATILMLRIQPVYASTASAIQAAADTMLPVQGKLISSIGQTQTNVVRKIQVNQSYKLIPFILDFTLFEEGN